MLLYYGTIQGAARDLRLGYQSKMQCYLPRHLRNHGFVFVYNKYVGNKNSSVVAILLDIDVFVLSKSAYDKNKTKLCTPKKSQRISPVSV